MKYVIDRSDASPAYLQLYRQVRDDIIEGNYRFDSKLPSKRIVAGELGLSTVTVEHAYALLCDEGYIESRQRSGYYVIFRAGDSFFASQADGPATRNGEADGSATRNGRAGGPAMRSSGADGSATRNGEADIKMPGPSDPTAMEFPFSVLAKAMRRVISEYGESILDRSPNYGRMELRTAISRYLARSRGIDAEPAQIVIGSGSEYLYGLIVELLGRDRIYAIESPSYKKIEQVYAACDVRYEKLPLGNDGIESRALWESHADILHISPYRSFPSGVTASASKRHEYMRWAASGRYLVEDDFESEFSLLGKPEETLFAHTADDNVIYMNTFSQTISPSLRVGYMVLPAHLMGEFDRKLGFYSCTVPTYLQLVLTELIAGGDFERHINRVRRKKRLAAGMKE